MLEAKFEKAHVLKQVLDAIKELVSDVNFDCDEDGMKLQAMDNSHVALVALALRTNGFSQFRCDRNMSLGINVGSFQKIVKCAGNDDIVTLRAQDEADSLNLVFETLNTDRVAEYDMKLMDIDIEHLSIPVTVYDAEITLPAAEFNRIVRDLKEMGESIRIEATKEGVKFSSDGDIGKASVTLKQTDFAKKKPMVIDDDDDEKEEDEDEEEEEEHKVKVKDKKPVVIDDTEDEDKEEVKQGKMEEDEAEVDGDEKVKKEIIDDDDEDPEVVVEQVSNASDSDQEPQSKKRKLPAKKGKKATNGKAAAKPKNKKKSEEDKQQEEEEARAVSITLRQSVSLTFSIKYLSNFTKATPLATKVILHMSNEVPLLVEYDFSIGYVRYYLAPKIEDD